MSLPNQCRKVLLEVCASSFHSALSAQDQGADRIELCQNLEGGGTTPSYGLIKLCKEQLHTPIHVLIRPRTGDFVYDDHEVNMMLNDIQVCRDLGCEGVVLGILNTKQAVDSARCLRLIQAAKPMQVTFHRAFDDCVDQFEALESIICLGCTRILTSGAQPSAIEGLTRIKALISQADNRLIIMPGAGINGRNIRDILRHPEIREVHASLKMMISPSKSSRSMFGANRLETSPEAVRHFVLSLKSYPDVDLSQQTPDS